MIWLTWRQQRLEALIGGVILALFAALVLKTGLDLHAAYQSTGVAACIARQARDAQCQAIENAFQNSPFQDLSNLFYWFNFLPLVFGALLAAPVALELEQGTHRLAWTQSSTRLRWTAVKLGLLLVAAVLVGLTLTALLSWWHGPLDQVRPRLEAQAFDFEGLVPIAYTVFAVTLGLAVGTVLRRAIPAMGLTLTVFVALRLWLEGMRKHYVPPIAATFPAGTIQTHLSALDWVVDAGWKDHLGRVIDDATVWRLCTAVHGQGLDFACIQRQGIVRYAVYQPADRFWAFQGIESAIFLGLATSLVAFTTWWMRYRVT